MAGKYTALKQSGPKRGLSSGTADALMRAGIFDNAPEQVGPEGIAPFSASPQKQLNLPRTERGGPVPEGVQWGGIDTTSADIDQSVIPDPNQTSMDFGDVPAEYMQSNQTPVEREQRQEQIEAPQSLQQRFDLGGSSPELDSGYLGPQDLMKIWGPVNGPVVARSLIGLKNDFDLLGTARSFENTDKFPDPEVAQSEYESGLGVVQKGVASVFDLDMGFLKAPAEGQATLDQDGRYALTQESLFVGPQGLDASVVSHDNRVYRMDPDYLINAFVVVEAMLDNSGSFVPQGVIDTLSEDIMKQIGILDAANDSQSRTVTDIGRSVSDAWQGFRQVRAGGMDTQVNPKLFKRFSREANQLIGFNALHAYKEANPSYIDAVGDMAFGQAQPIVYNLTPTGRKALQLRSSQVSTPKFRVPPIIGETSKAGQPQYASSTRTKKTTGSQYDMGQVDVITDAIKFYSNVKSVVGGIRGKAAFGFGISALEEASSVDLTEGSANNHLTFVSDFFDVGHKRIDKIRNIPVEIEYQLNEAKKKLAAAQRYSGNDTDNMLLIMDVNVLSDFLELARTPEWQNGMYKKHATNQLEVLNALAHYKNDQIGFTFQRQLGNTRVTMHQHHISPQNHKMVRQVLGSPHLYSIRPMSNTDEEFGIVVSIAAFLLKVGGLKPDAVYRDTIKRMQSGNDPELKSLEAIGIEVGHWLLAFEDANAIRDLKQLESTPQGVMGVDNLLRNAELEDFKAILADLSQATRDFIDANAKAHPDEFINVLEATTELARYMQSYRSGKPYTTQMRMVAQDGIANGLAGLMAQLGQEHMMPRVGVYRPKGSPRILAEFEGLTGDPRDLLKYNLLTNPVSEIGKSSPEDAMKITRLIKLATEDKANFLKPPLMTFVYGQDLKSMKAYAVKAVISNPNSEIALIAGELGTDRAIKILNNALMGNLVATVGSDVVNYVNMLKNYVKVTGFVNEPIIYTQPTGQQTSVSGTVMTEAKLASAAVTRTRRKNEKGQFFDVANKKKFVAGNDGIYISEGGTSKSTVTSTYESDTSALYEKSGVAGLGASQGVLAQTTIGFDAASIVALVTGKSLQKLRASQNGRNPYLIPVYDEIITDAGSFRSAYKAINDAWLDTTLNYDLIGEMQKGIREATHRGLANLRALAEGNPSGSPADPNHAKYVYSEMGGMSSLTSIYHPKLADRAAAYLSMLDKKSSQYGDAPWAYITNKELYQLALAVFNDSGVKNLANNFEALRLHAKEGRKKIRANAKDVHQYTLDSLREAD